MTTPINNFNNICKQILSFDSSIRFAGIATIDKGKIVAAEYREGIIPLLTIDEYELSIVQSVIRTAMRKTLEEKIGRTIYASTLYEKIRRATIIMYNNETDKSEYILMLSFDGVEATPNNNHEKIILEKIIPFLKQIGKDPNYK